MLPLVYPVCVCVSVCACVQQPLCLTEGSPYFLFEPVQCLFGIKANHLIILTKTDTLTLISPRFVTRLFSLNTETGIATLIALQSHNPPV